MSALRRLRNLWMPWVAVIVLGCFSDAVAQTSYRVIDLGVVNDKDNLGCAMDLNKFGRTLSQEGVLDPVSNFSGAPVLTGRAVINIGEFKIDLGTLGGPNSWMNWGGINDFAQAVGDKPGVRAFVRTDLLSMTHVEVLFRGAS
jgi:hypothetical protein